MKNDETESIITGQADDTGGNPGYGEISLLHSGSYADTYRAKKAGRYFLLKAAHDGDTRFQPMLRREYEISVGLEHPCIATSFTFEEQTPVGPCIAMEYVVERTPKIGHLNF